MNNYVMKALFIMLMFTTNAYANKNSKVFENLYSTDGSAKISIYCKGEVSDKYFNCNFGVKFVQTKNDLSFLDSLFKNVCIFIDGSEDILLKKIAYNKWQGWSKNAFMSCGEDNISFTFTRMSEHVWNIELERKEEEQKEGCIFEKKKKLVLTGGASYKTLHKRSCSHIELW